MQKLTLEFTKLELLKKRGRWKLYFILVTEHPEDNDKLIVSTFPEPYIRLKPNQDNIICFEPEGSPGADGYFVLERSLPADNCIKTRLYMRQSRKDLRNLGDALKDLKSSLGGDAFGIASDIIGSTAPWLVISKKALPLLGTVLNGTKDRDMGFVSMDEKFDEVIGQYSCLIRANTFSTGEAKIYWKWKTCPN